VNMTSGEFMFKIHLCSYVTLFGLKSDEMTKLIVLLMLSNICSFASGIKLLLVSVAWIFGVVGPARVYFGLYLFSM